MNILEIESIIIDKCIVICVSNNLNINKMNKIQLNNSTYSFKTMKLESNNSYLIDSQLKALKGRNFSILTYLRIKKLNTIQKEQEYALTKRKNTEQPTIKINRFSSRRRLTEPNVQRQFKKEKPAFITQNPQNYNKNTYQRIDKSKTNFFEQPQAFTTSMKNYFPQRKTKKNKDSRWYGYLCTNKVQQISLKIESDANKKLYLRNRLQQNKTFNVKRCVTSDINMRKSTKKERIESMRKENQDISPWIPSINDSQKSMRKFD